MKNNSMFFPNTILDNIPIRMVTTQSIFPNNDECNDFEYSFFFVNLVSRTCITANDPNTIGILYQNSSILRLLKYPKYVASTITTPTPMDAANEK